MRAMGAMIALGCLWWDLKCVAGSHRYCSMWAIHSSVLMLVYMLSASYVNIDAFAGRVMPSSSFFRSKEFLKYVDWPFTIG